ncbi:mediator of RNA polymerase II transcription subunit 34-like [Dendronephthya gigantea]|uniref:mediator of RNA polymerase II transcription subunit 34-like n=1 Tax=Dendronephthya gigantea TaxID=151771 RepID=UPI00106D4C00|nr:mediator of RNA polymerase II transcription subunit 34-like [Dendronephthya gigantea]
MCVLPTGYGKSLIFHLLPLLLFAKFKLRGDLLTGWKSKGVFTAAVDSIVIVVSPLNSLISDQISRLSVTGIRASIVNTKEAKLELDSEDIHADEVDIDFSRCEEDKLRDEYYHIVFAHPESFISSKFGRDSLLSKHYQEHLVAIVDDEAHCIVEWGSEFREDYGKLGVLCALFPDVPCLAMTATASRADINAIIDSLGLKNCKLVIGNPDRKNIFYSKGFRHGQDLDAIQCILMPIAEDLLEQRNEYPLTIVYVPLRLCGFAYKLFEHVLGSQQYFPVNSLPIPSNRLFAQFHSPQTNQMKEEILKQLCSKCSVVRVVFATIAIGMGVDIPDIRQIIHVVPPCSMKAYFQETGRAGRDGKPSLACLYYNNPDIAKNRQAMNDDMRNYCSNASICLGKLLLNSLDAEQIVCMKPLHICCSVCKLRCDCFNCAQVDLGEMIDNVKA